MTPTTTCGRFAQATDTPEQVESLPADGKSCETCLRQLARRNEAPSRSPFFKDPSWVRFRPGLSWHVARA
jgi:hypothetical protein